MLIMQKLARSVLKNLTTSVLFLLGLLTVITVCIETTSAQSRPEAFKFRTITVVDGLPENTGVALAQTPDGYVWIGTQNGLSRSDANGLKTFKMSPDDSLSLSNDAINRLYVDPNGRLWVGTNNGINLYNPITQKFKRFLYQKDTEAYNFTGAIRQDKDGYIWTLISNIEGIFELHRFHPDKNSFKQFSTDPDQAGSVSGSSILVSSDFDAPLIIDSQNTMWLGTNGGGLNRFDSKTEQFTHIRSKPGDSNSLASDNVYAIHESVHEPGMLWIMSFELATGKSFLQKYNPSSNSFETVIFPKETQYSNFIFFDDPDGFMWVGDQEFLHKYDPNRKSFTSFAFPKSQQKDRTSVVLGLQKDYLNRIWIRTEYTDDMLVFDPRQESFLSVNMKTSNQSGLVTFSMLSDHSGIIWIGSWSYGVYILKPLESAFNHFRFELPGGNSFNRVLSIYQDKPNRVWLGTNFSALTQYNPVTGSWLPVNLPTLKGYSVNAIHPKDENHLWLGVRNANGVSGVYVLNTLNLSLRSELATINPEFGGISGVVRKIFTDSKANTWFAIDGFGLLKLNPKAEIQRYSYTVENANQYPDAENRPFSFFERSNGELWVSTNRAMLKYNPDLDNFSIVEGSWLSILSMTEAKDGAFWAGSYLDGLLKYDPTTNQMEVLANTRQMQTGAIFQLRRYDENTLWMSTAGGLTQLFEEPFNFINYGQNAGVLPGIMSQLAKLNDGSMIVSGEDGFYRFKPSEIRPNPNAPKVALNTIRVFNQELWPLAQTEDLPIYNGSTIQLRYDQNLITLSYDGLYFANTDEIKYSHFLKGFDEEWSLPSNNRQTTYTNLDPGTYTFVVKASNSDNVWSEEVVLLTFEITPPWWQTWWAYGSYVILFFAFTAYSYEYQRQRVLKVEQEKNRERELEHARQIERAYSDLEVAHENLKSAQKQLVEQEKLASLGQLTAGIAHEIKNPLNFVNNFSAVSIELVDEAVADVEKYVDKEEDRSFILETLSFVKGNLAKILDHGTRADGIVKSMLMHSRGGSGTMEPTSLNEIVKEYVNLAYHGMRAGKNIINVDVELSLDESVGNIPMIAEDFSRVILNLCNNAFDAMRDLIKKETPNYKARLKVSTRKEGSKIIVEVKDNGPGIPDDIRDKILEPFFTTKKGTEGTGLGLSITHDIVTAHNGTLEIDSDESGACFRIIIQA